MKKNIINNKGFTLTEILVTIVLIGIIAVVVVSSVLGVSSSIKTRELNAKKISALVAAELYAKNNFSEIDDSYSPIITINTLIATGYMVPDINYNEGICVNPEYTFGCFLNPKDSNEILNNENIKINKRRSITKAIYSSNQTQFGNNALSGYNGSTFPASKTIIVNFNSNNPNIVLEYNSLSCTKVFGSGEEESCVFTLPNISGNESNYNVLGWNENQNDRNTFVNENTVTVNFSDSGKTYYLHSEKSYSLYFLKNQTESLTYDVMTDVAFNFACSIFDNETGCQISSAIPVVNPSEGYHFAGWSTNPDAIGGISSEDLIKTIYGNKIYYAIQSNRDTTTLWVKLYKNGATKIGDGDDDILMKECAYYTEEASECTITIPSITRQSLNDGMGWNINENATTSLNGWTYGTDITITPQEDGNNYYAISKKIVTLAFDANGISNFINPSDKSCTIWNSASSCEITPLPTIPEEEGYVILGWATEPNSIVSDYASGATNERFTNSDTLYAIKQLEN